MRYLVNTTYPIFMNLHFRILLSLQGKPGSKFSTGDKFSRCRKPDCLSEYWGYFASKLTSLFQNKPWQQQGLILQPKPRRERTPDHLSHLTLRCLLSEKMIFHWKKRFKQFQLTSIYMFKTVLITCQCMGHWVNSGKWKIGNLTKITCSPLIFSKLNNFRQKYFRIVLCSVSL